MMIAGQCLCVLALVLCLYKWRERPRKQFKKEEPTNILITGGVQGLGKLLAMQFAKRHPNGEVNIIVLDVAANLAD